ncbi:MAG: cupredoxin domain-containing protein [Candidatus Marsarchaeota archaeon]|nr:cupredoxin domain-containing protein [Candidatus Marsarchaeota archaeon]
MKTHEILAAVVLVAMVAWVSFMAGNAQTVTAAGTGTITDVYGQTGANAGAAAGVLPSANANNAPAAGGAPTAAPAEGEVVTIPIKVVGGYYEPRTITVKQGTRVRLDLDPNSFRGCMTVFNVWGLNLQKLVTANDHFLEFTASQPGTYRTSCSMGMGDGRLIIEPASGAGAAAAPVKTDSSAQLAPPSPGAAGPSGGSCGSGGCGCGGAR